MQHEPRHTQHASRSKSVFRLCLSIFVIMVSILVVYMYNERHEKTQDTSKVKSTIDNMKQEKLIPRAVLFGNPEKIAVRLSPNGENMSYIAPHNGVLNIFLSKPGSDAQPITNDTHRGIRSYFWSYDNKHVIYQQDKNGDENHHLFSVDIDTNEITELTPMNGVKVGDITTSKHFPNYALVTLNERRKDLFDLYLLDIKNKNLHHLYKNDQYVNIAIDDDFQMRFGTMPTPNGGTKTDMFAAQSGEFSIPALIEAIEAQAKETANTIKHREYINEITSRIQNTSTSEFLLVGPEDVYTTGVVGFSDDKNVVYMMDSRERDKSALFEFNISNNEKKLIFENDKADVSDILQHPITKQIQAISYNYARNKWYFFDKGVEKTFEKVLAKSDSDGEATIVSRSIDDKNWIIAVDSDVSPVKYYKASRDDGSIEYLFSGDSKLSQYELNHMHPVVITARDGLKLMSYLTLPKDAKTKIDIDNGDHVVKTIETDRAFPLVLYVHGGPTARDDWGLDKTHQWLSDRGYVVLSVNYRGSTGFGKNFINAGNGEWSRKMHDDLIDAAKWAIQSKITTQGDIAIMGGSYGGYAALVGLTFTPDFFKCAVDIVGPSNLLTLMNSIPEYWKPMLENLKRKIGGDPATEEGRIELELRSPLTYVDKISKPLLVGQGANDPRVKQAESDQIVNTMIEKNIPVIYALYPDEGHGFARPENRMSFFVLTEYFLHQYMGGMVEVVHDNDFNGSSLQLLAGERMLPEVLNEKLELNSDQ